MTATTTTASEATLRQVGIAHEGQTTWEDSNRLFVAIGGVPHTEWAKDTAIVRDGAGYLVTGPDLMSDGGDVPAVDARAGTALSRDFRTGLARRG